MLVLAGAAGLGSGVVTSCSDRGGREGACYFDDTADASKYLPPMAWQDWCDYKPGEISALVEHHCPAGECVDTFITCDEVPVADDCRRCPADELDQKVLVALGARYEELCPNGPHEIIDFERGCVFERMVASLPPDMKQCCYTAVVVGECALMGT